MTVLRIGFGLLFGRKCSNKTTIIYKLEQQHTSARGHCGAQFASRLYHPQNSVARDHAHDVG